MEGYGIGTKKGIREFYDATAESWAERWYADESMLPLLQRFVALCGQRPRMLDAGCGAGYESMRLSRLGAQVTGFDFSQSSLAIARKRNPSLTFIQADCLSLPADLGPFDGVVAIALLVHIPDEQLEKAFWNLRNVSKEGGYLLLAYVQGDGYDEKRSHAQIGDEEYDRAFFLHTAARMSQAAARSGWMYREDWTLPEQDGGWTYPLFAAAPPAQ